MAVHVTEAFLLCGGSSERLGFAKEMLRVDGAPLAVAMVRKLQGLFDDVAVVSNRPAYLEHWLSVPVYCDEFPGLGPLAGIHAGLERSRGERAFFLACDMPFVPDETIRRIAAAASDSLAPATVVRTRRGLEPVCGVYSRSLLPMLRARLEASQGLAPWDFLTEAGAQYIELRGQEAAAMRDIDTPADVGRLKALFHEVEPLPVRREQVTRLGGRPMTEDIVVEERPFALYVNGVHLVTILCLPVALRELTTGFLAYMGLIERCDDIRRMQRDYEAGRIAVELDADEGSLRKAVRLQISSTCGAGVYGPALPRLAESAARDGFRVSAEHILELMRKLRKMAPVFASTGATHQAAFSDGRAVLHFYEDVGRHNAIDKVLGRCLIDGTDMSRGLLLATGRLNAEMVVKTLRHGIPVAVSRSAVTAHALKLAGGHGLTVVGFARARRLNVYTCPERIIGG